jgi:hypothetical protein
MHTFAIVGGSLLWQRTDSPHFWNSTRRFIVNVKSNEVFCFFEIKQIALCRLFVRDDFSEEPVTGNPNCTAFLHLKDIQTLKLNPRNLMNLSSG